MATKIIGMTQPLQNHMIRHKSCTCTEWVTYNIVMHGILMIYISCMSCIKSHTYVILFALFTCCNKHAISQQKIIGNPMISTANGRPCLTTTLSTNSRPNHAWGKSMSPIWFVDVSTSMPTNTSCTITLLYHIIIFAFLTWRGNNIAEYDCYLFQDHAICTVICNSWNYISLNSFFPLAYFSNQFDVNKNIRNNKIISINQILWNAFSPKNVRSDVLIITGGL